MWMLQEKRRSPTRGATDTRVYIAISILPVCVLEHVWDATNAVSTVRSSVEYLASQWDLPLLYSGGAHAAWICVLKTGNMMLYGYPARKHPSPTPSTSMARLVVFGMEGKISKGVATSSTPAISAAFSPLHKSAPVIVALIMMAFVSRNSLSN